MQGYKDFGKPESLLVFFYLITLNILYYICRQIRNLQNFINNIYKYIIQFGNCINNNIIL